VVNIIHHSFIIIPLTSPFIIHIHSFVVARFLDSLVYFFLPQINVTILRIIQGRNLRHRMVGRTVVIGDIPWVSQAADAFLSKIFACSYSIAGLNVLSGNPTDHLVHRHTSPCGSWQLVGMWTTGWSVDVLDVCGGYCMSFDQSG
jgi:hypothetical protein